MNEFGEQLFARADSIDIERAAILAEAILPGQQPDTPLRQYHWTKVDDNTTTYLGVCRGVTSRGTDYIEGAVVVEDHKTKKVLATRYALDLEAGCFLTTRDLHDSLDSITNEEDIMAHDVNSMMFDMGLYNPDENDWEDFIGLIQDGNDHYNRIKAINDFQSLAVRLVYDKLP